MNQYCIKTSEKQVVACSQMRISFEPKGTQMDFRNEMRKAISELRLGNNEIAIASFCTTENAFFDVENILVYNIGPNTFATISKNGIHVVKSNETIDAGFSNKYEYLIADKKKTLSELEIKKSNAFLQFQFTLKKFNTALKPSDYWLAFHDGNTEIENHETKKFFGVFIDVHLPNECGNIVSMMKPMIDGIISGMHSENLKDGDAEIRLSKILNVPNERITELLYRKDFSILGERNLISAYRDGLKWNPEDERCIEITIIPHENKSIERAEVKGYVYWL